jgi:hypothetical protein
MLHTNSILRLIPGRNDYFEVNIFFTKNLIFKCLRDFVYCK